MLCCDSWLQHECYLKTFKTIAFNRFFKFVLLGYTLSEFEQLLFVSSCCLLLVVSVLDALKFTRRLLTLIERISFKFGPKIIVFATENGLERLYCSFGVLVGKCERAAGVVGGVSLIRALTLIAGGGSVELLFSCARGHWRYGAELLDPLRFKAKNVLVCAYGAGVAVYCELVLGVCSRLLFYRIRALLFCVNSMSSQSGISNYELALCGYVPVAVVGLTSFACARMVDVHNSVVFQLAVSSERLRNLVRLKCALSSVELCQKLSLPETEGKVFVRAFGFACVSISYKCGVYTRVFKTIFNRLNFAIRVLLLWFGLKSAGRAIVFLLFNYPTSDSRIGNGVGLDTIASVINVHSFLEGRAFLTSAKLMCELLLGVTNYSNLNRITRGTVCLRARVWMYNDVVTTQLWGSVGVDPFVIGGFISLSVYRTLNSYIAIQSTRGYGLVNPNVYHSMFVAPCRLYWASYVYYERAAASALIINVGKHGSLEWLPGRANILSRSCYPELVGLGLPSLYFYILNDPGEGTQAKRRIGSVVIDHFLPPLQMADKLVSLGRVDESFGYSRFNKKYYCNLLGLFFKRGLHVYGVFKTASAIKSLFALLSWRFNLTFVSVCKRISVWNKSFALATLELLGFWSGALSVLGVRAMLLILKNPMLLLAASCYYELYSVVKALNVKFVLPGLSSSFSRADRRILPSGRNFYCRDVLNVPTPWAYAVSVSVVNKLLRAYYKRSCRWLRAAGISVWATSNMRTGGDDIATILRLIGVRPVWSAKDYRVVGFEIIPLMHIRYLRVSVLVRLSGLFRDVYFCVVNRLYKVFDTLTSLSCFDSACCEHVNCNLFCSEPGHYGVGIQELLDSGSWVSTSELAKKYVFYGCYRYDGSGWEKCASLFVGLLAGVEVVLHSQDNYEHDILDSDDYYQFEGGMNVAVRHFRSKVCGYHIDTSRAVGASIKVRRLKYEIDRILKYKLLNKDWLFSALEHGYKGVSEILAGLSYFCNFALTSFQVSSSQLASVCKLLISNARIRNLITLNSAGALFDIKRKLAETISKGAWGAVSSDIRFCLEI
ncbi:cobaltochelatase subunit CobN [Candidatus Hodgkinia cicadicola]